MLLPARGGMALSVFGSLARGSKPSLCKSDLWKRALKARRGRALSKNANDAPDSASPVIVWFRLDLRLSDNPALRAAAETRCPLIPFFIWAPDEEDPWPPGAASRWWLHQSLAALQKDLASKKSRLILRNGPSLDALQQVAAETGAKAVFWNRRYEPAVIARDARVKEELLNTGLAVQTFNAALLFEPWTVLQKSTARPFQVFSAFWKACLHQPERPEPASAPKLVQPPRTPPGSLALDDLRLEPRIDWAAGIRAAWTPGESGAKSQLAKCLRDPVRHYAFARHFPDLEGTSRLSPHLHFGEISPREIWHKVLARRNADSAPSVDAYLRELGWREFAYHLLFHFPQTANEPLRPEFSKFPWRNDTRLLKKWQKGLTGYPFVDAGMRELWTTGWMHNRLRLVVASFLTKHLRINWEEGAYWFWDTLVDADLANNTLGWQWTAGCGADAAPYFRIFNPVLQSQKFDSDGNYVRRWIPELGRLPSPWIQKPWLAPAAALAGAGVELGRNYPLPVVEHEAARREALAAFERVKRGRTPASIA